MHKHIWYMCDDAIIYHRVHSGGFHRSLHVDFTIHIYDIKAPYKPYHIILRYASLYRLVCHMRV